MFKWQKGRQDSGYSKITFFISAYFKCDFYLLRIPAGTGVPPHKDPSPDGYEHHRINFTINRLTYPPEVMYINGIVKRWWRFDYFRPDLYEHWLHPVEHTVYMFSFGWLKKNY